LRFFTGKSTKSLSKIIKYEGKIEQKALSVALQELADLQKNQKSAVKVKYLVAILLYLSNPYLSVKALLMHVTPRPSLHSRKRKKRS
jgi:hypothetical protein